MATVTGLFFIPGMLGVISTEADILLIVQKTLPLPVISFLITVGMYILNDLLDADLDRANGKKRPIPSGLVSKRQAWTFIIATNATALILSIITFNPTAGLIVSAMLIIGIMYSAPKIALMKRFLIKTITIAIYYCLCALLGATSYGTDMVMNNPVILAHGLSMLAIMIFISSTLNDLGDVAGDRAAGRRTVPIVIGEGNTIKLCMILAISMLPLTWLFYGLATAVADDRGNLIMAITASLFSVLLASKMAAMGKSQQDMESMRRHHKKLFPLNLVLQSNVAMGGVIVL
jgi:geranylgeranylglycerol-phosphate geranylgeranyltransferase